MEKSGAENAPERAEVVRLIKERGINDSEAREAFVNWMEAEKFERRLTNLTPTAAILSQIEAAKVLIDAGEIDEAREMLAGSNSEDEENSVLGELYHEVHTKNSPHKDECVKLAREVYNILESL